MARETIFLRGSGCFLKYEKDSRTPSWMLLPRHSLNHGVFFKEGDGCFAYYCGSCSFLL